MILNDSGAVKPPTTLKWNRNVDFGGYEIQQENGSNAPFMVIIS